jgi:predicted nucleotide-binding protein
MLEVSVPIAHELLAQCVRQGQALVQRASLVGDFSDYESWKAARHQWIEPTAQALEHMYGDSAHAGEFTQTVRAAGDGQRWQQQYVADLDAIKAGLELLTVLQSDLAFAREDADPDAAPGAPELTASPELPPEPPPAELPGSPEPAPEPLPAEPPPEQPASQAQQQRAAQPPPRPFEDQPAAAPRPPDAPRPAEQVDLAGHTAPDERLDERPAVGAELAPAPFVGAELAQHASGSASAERAGTPAPAPAHGKQIVLAHGRNEQWMQAVARLLEHAGTHEVTILNERPNGRGTLAEQFGEHAPGARYALVLLTADDIAAPRVDSEQEPYFSPRAHQAVVFEMGFLVAALSPGQVCVLYEEGVQLPCDLDGIAYVRLDLAGTWQPKLLLQLRKAGFDYDMNKLVAA